MKQREDGSIVDRAGWVHVKVPCRKVHRPMRPCLECEEGFVWRRAHHVTTEEP